MRLSPLAAPHPLSSVLRLGLYRRVLPAPGLSPMGRSLLAFKYSGDRRAGRKLARLFASSIVRQPRIPDLVTAIPLSPGRLAKRGFNQSAWLARAAARALQSPLDLGLLKRNAGPGAQVGLNAQLRLTNLRTAFCARRRLEGGPRVLLIDDVMTTGATLSAAATAILDAGAAQVDAAVLASTQHPGQL